MGAALFFLENQMVRAFATRELNALDGQHHEVADERDLFLHERFGVADAGEGAVVAGFGEGALADFFFGAMDGGIDTRKTEDEKFYGPFATISLGL